MKRPTPAARALTEALRRCFDTIRTERAAELGSGELPKLPLIRGRWAAMHRAWAACPGAEAVYRAAREAWLRETGTCGVGGEPAPCNCDSAHAAERGAA